MSLPDILPTATVENRQTDMGTSLKVVRLIPKKNGLIFLFYGAKPNLKATPYHYLFATSKRKSRIINGLTCVDWL